MTFEEYKKHFETFSKIDNAEKLAICESQYQRHLLHIEDENYFEPIQNRLGSDKISQYEQNLNEIFRFDKIKENEFYFLVSPSFEPENLLILERLEDKYILTHTTLVKNYWAVFYADNRIRDIRKKVLISELKKAAGDKLFVLLNRIISEARKPKANNVILDGVVYRLSRISEGKQEIVSKNSPSEGSKSAKVIAVMEQLIAYIERLDNTIILSIEAMIDDLQNWP